MKKTMIESYNNKFARELEEALRIIKPKMIDAFTNVFGASHHDFIKNTIDNLDYMFFVPKRYFKIGLNDPIGIRKHDIYLFKKYLNYLTKMKNKCKTISRGVDEFLIDSFLPRFPFNKNELIDFWDLLNTDCPCFRYYVKNDVYNLGRVILLPIFIIDLRTIMHEVTHSLITDIVGYTDEELVSIQLFPTDLSEDLVTDYIAGMALKEYFRIGGVIPKALKRVKISDSYEWNSYIAEIVFDGLEPLILESAITKNHNLFYTLLGRENVDYLASLMEILYTKGFDENIYLELMLLVENLYNKVINTHICTKEEQLKNAEEAGYKLRRVNF